MKVIGMISGTSYDAIEAVAMEMSFDGEVINADLLGHVSVPYDAHLRQMVDEVMPPSNTSIEKVCQLDTLIGQSFAAVAARLNAEYFDDAADVVCSHGQTVFHWVNDGHALGTLQVGQPAWIAELTGATVVFDIRSRDIASGGHGAPLASLLDVLLLGRRPGHVRGALNLGGISNMTVVGPTLEPIAFDIGPANALMDAAVTWLSGGVEVFDDGGRRGARGTVDEALLSVFLEEPYYAAPAPKSTGKELFHAEYLRERIGERAIAPDDLVATLTALTAETVAAAVSALQVSELFVSGGGTRNPTLMFEIERRLPNVRIERIDVLGVEESAKEAALMSLIGFLTVHEMEGTIASCTGAAKSQILGAIVPGRQPVLRRAEQPTPTSIVFVKSHERMRH
jgi:anhydro-N-acetylmuramic acid kinase